MGVEKGVEIEVKLDFTPEELKKFRQWSGLRKISNEPIKRACLRAQYFDTKDWELVKQKSSIRIRREFGKWVQTAKMVIAGGDVHKRIEVNWTIPKAELDLTLDIDDPKMSEALTALNGKEIVEIFRTRIWRTVRVLNYRNSTIELAIDAGHIFAGDKSVVVSEAELELLSGDVEDLTALAKEWQQHFDFKIGGASKAARGYSLAA